MTTDHIRIQKTAKVCLVGDISSAQVVLFALHGYGHLAQFFARKFEPLKHRGICVIVPEGLHRFYLQGTQGRVGASWMTKEEREIDIDDYVSYLDQVWEHYKGQAPSAVKKVLLGFSQGGATAARWHVRGGFDADKFILHSAVLPPDLDWNMDPEKFSRNSNFMIVGDQDEYRSLDQGREDVASWKNAGMEFSMLEFEGGHEICIPILENILELA